MSKLAQKIYPIIIFRAVIVSLLYAQVYSFDVQYLNYFKSKNNNQPSDNVFAQGGDQIAWNVIGDHVIGLFMGDAAVKFIKVN